MEVGGRRTSVLTIKLVNLVWSSLQVTSTNHYHNRHNHHNTAFRFAHSIHPKMSRSKAKQKRDRTHNAQQGGQPKNRVAEEELLSKPLSRFEFSPQLHSLALPQAALLSIRLENMRSLEIDHGDFDLHPNSVLPPKLQYLKVFDADAELLQSLWLVSV